MKKFLSPSITKPNGAPERTLEKVEKRAIIMQPFGHKLEVVTVIVQLDFLLGIHFLMLELSKLLMNLPWKHVVKYNRRHDYLKLDFPHKVASFKRVWQILKGTLDPLLQDQKKGTSVLFKEVQHYLLLTKLCCS